MNKWILTIAFLFMSLTRLSAQAPEHHLGFGILAGEPSGLSLLVNFTEIYAIQGAVAYTLNDGDTERMQYQVDLIMYVPTNDGGIDSSYRGYIGMGMLYKQEADETQDTYGIRIPFGVSVNYDEYPFEFFFEFAPVMDVSPETKLDWNAGVGLRFLFF